MSRALALCPSRVDVWLLHTAADPRLRAPEVLSAYRAMLSTEEAAQMDRFALDRSKHEYLMTRALVRSTLSLYFPTTMPPAWRFGKNEFGKPHVVDSPAVASADLRFNVAHSDGLIALAVACRADVGVDCESAARLGRHEDIAERFFSPAEVFAFNRMSDVSRRQMFIDMWVLKEACIKAVGMGLSMPLDSFSVLFGRDGFSYPKGPLCATNVTADGAVDLRLYEFGLHKLALCILDQHTLENPRSVQFYKTAPLVEPAVETDVQELASSLHAIT